MSDAARRRRVLYISGAPRSGTTLLGMALGQLAGVADAGELWALWRPAYANRDLCGCGRPIPECPFWVEVARRALGDDYEACGRAVGALHRRALGTGRALGVWLHVTGRRRRPEYQRYGDVLARHYRAIADVSGANLIVDSSKMASDALVASNIEDVELWVVHLVRDPRGVAWSSSKVARQPSGRPMARHGPLSSAMRWDAYNGCAEALVRPRVGDRFRRVIYEQFVADPARTLRNLARWLDVDTERGEFPIRPATESEPPALLVTRESHPVWGNPLRTARGPLPIRPDDDWRRSLPTPARRLVTAATAPGLLLYGYSLGASGLGAQPGHLATQCSL